MTRLTAEQRAHRAMSEDDLRAQADDLAALYGFEWMTVGPLRTSHGWRTPTRGPLGKGWPDTFYVRRRDNRRFFIEFKRELGTVEPEQRAVHEALIAVGLPTHVIRPSDFDRLVELFR